MSEDNATEDEGEVEGHLMDDSGQPERQMDDSGQPDVEGHQMDDSGQSEV